MRRMRAAAVIAAVAVVVLLTGCVPAEPTAETTPTRSPTRSASPSGSPTPTPSPTTAPFVLSTAGLGPLRMGSPVPTANDLVAWNPRACESHEDSGGTYGMWTPTVALTGSSPLGRDQPFGLVTVGGEQFGAISFIQVWSSQYRTPSGLHVGSTNAEVRAALPKASVLDTGQSLEYGVVSGGWRIAFTVAESDSGPIGDGTVVQVISVHPASDGEITFWATDGGAFCGA